MKPKREKGHMGNIFIETVQPLSRELIVPQ